MSTEQAGALAAMEKSVRVLYRRNEAVNGKKLDEARADMAELIEAGKELQAAQAHYDALDCPGGARWDRLALARERHAAALARAQGAGA